MIDARAFGQGLQGRVLTQSRKSRQAVTDSVRTWALAVQTARRQITGSSTTADLPALARLLPSPLTVVMGAFDIAEQLLAAQRKLVERLTGQLTGQTVPAAKPEVIGSAAAAVRAEPGSEAAEVRKPTAAKAVAPQPAAAEKPAASEAAAARAGAARKPAPGRTSAARRPAAATAAARNGAGARDARSAGKEA